MVQFKRRKFFRILTVLTLSTFASGGVCAAREANGVLPTDLGMLRDDYFLGDEGFYIFRSILKVIVPFFSVFAEYEKVVFVSTENIIRDCLGKREIVAISKAVVAVNKQAVSGFNRAFYRLADADKKTILAAVERDPQTRDAVKQIKKIALYSFFTSEYGATKKLRYSPVPGSFIGSVKLKKDDSSWAE